MPSRRAARAAGGAVRADIPAGAKGQAREAEQVRVRDRVLGDAERRFQRAGKGGQLVPAGQRGHPLDPGGVAGPPEPRRHRPHVLSRLRPRRQPMPWWIASQQMSDLMRFIR